MYAGATGAAHGDYYSGSCSCLLSGCIERGATPDMENSERKDAMIPDAASLPDGRVIEIVEVGVRPDMGL